MSNEHQPYPNPSNDPDQQGSHAAGQGQHGQDQHAQQQYGQPQQQYGQPQQQYGQPQPHGAWGDPAHGGIGKPRNALAVVGLVLAVLALLTSWIPLVGVVGLLLAVIAIILGIVGVRRVKKHVATNRGVAIAAIVIGVIALIIGAVVLIGIIVLAANGGADYANCVAQAGNDQVAVQTCADQYGQNLMDRFGN